MNIKDLEIGLVFSVQDCIAVNANNDYQPMCQLKEGAVIQIRELVPDRNLVLITPEPMPLAVHTDSLKGIPVTSKLLIKIGFTHEADFTFPDFAIPMNAYRKNILGQDVIIVENCDDLCLIYNDSQLIVVKYVHSLQLQVRERYSLDITFDGIERFLGE